jgi:hypothetical protein
MRTLRETDVETEISSDPIEDQSLDPGGSLEPDSD